MSNHPLRLIEPLPQPTVHDRLKHLASKCETLDFLRDATVQLSRESRHQTDALCSLSAIVLELKQLAVQNATLIALLSKGIDLSINPPQPVNEPDIPGQMLLLNDDN